MGKEQDSKYYDDIFGDPSSQFQRSAETLPWYKLWKPSAMWIVEHQIENVIDLGCGPGHFATVLNTTNNHYSNLGNFKQYHGYDFSPVAIEVAKKRINDDRFHFVECDLKKYDFLENYKEQTMITAFEFLEHINFDLEIIEKIPSGVPFAFSVPYIDGPGHVRCFKTLESVNDRYAPFIKFYNLFQMGDHYLGIGIKK